MCALSADRYFNHVAPSETFQPLDVGDAASPSEYSVEISLLREYAEELHDRREFRQGKHVRTDVEAGRWVRWLGRKRAKGEVFVRYTGVSVSLMTLRPEICVLILFRNPGAAREWKPNWEFLKRKHELLLPDAQQLAVGVSSPAARSPRLRRDRDLTRATGPGDHLAVAGGGVGLGHAG